MSAGNTLLRSTMYLLLGVYYVLVVHMSPLQLILTGTALELVYFLFQLPTGAFADLFGRRRSIILGWLIVGLCFLAIGLFPVPGAIIAANGLLGIGEALIDGAESAWLADEVGEAAYGAVLLRGSQAAQLAGIAGIGVAATLGSVHLSWPILAGGAGMLLLAGYFVLAMPEDGFQRHQEERSPAAMLGTMAASTRLVRGSPVLLSLLGVELFAGGGSEGWDRLWRAYLLLDVRFPAVAHLTAVLWFGLFAIAGSILAYLANAILRPRLAPLTSSPRRMARALAALNVLVVASTIGFAWSGSVVPALCCLLLRGTLMTPIGLVNSVWINSAISDSSVRATVLSLSGQANALGQWVGGPITGVIGNAASVRLAITAAGIINAPMVPIYLRAGRLVMPERARESPVNG